MDGFFGFKLGRLRYRSLSFERFETQGDHQGNAVINYCEESVPFTRITEHKHFAPWEEHERSVCFREYSKLASPTDTPYYPLRLDDDKRLAADYMRLAKESGGITFIGRLGTYRYLDMHVVIGESLDLARSCLNAAHDPGAWPLFSSNPV